MKPEVDGIRVPDLAAMRWLNTGTARAPDFKGKVLLVDFWDYSCVNCLRTLPYLGEWHERYGERGLVMAGVHAPEFPFGREEQNVERAVRTLGVAYPVALDPEFHTWQAFHNRYWPSKYLFDARGMLRYFHFGEGDYEGCERAIQECLAELAPGAEWPEPMLPLRPEDRPGLARLPGTAELYLGAERGRLGNAEKPGAGEVGRFVLPGRRDSDRLYAEGPWRMERKHLESVGREPAALHLRYSAVEVNLVLANASNEPIEVEIAQDGAALSRAVRGEDVGEAASGATVFSVDEARMYRLVRNAEHGTHDLRVTVDRAGLRAYAATFVAGVDLAASVAAVPGDSPHSERDPEG